MMGKLDGKVALITGAGSGIGRASALLFASEGADIAVADYIPAGGNETVDIIKNSGGKAVFIEADISKSSDIEEMLSQTVTTLGRLDILFNNAGIVGRPALTEELTEEDWDGIITTNLKGVVLSSKHAIPIMVKQGGGVIVNTASIHGLLGLPGNPLYGVSKAGIILLTKQMAADYAKQNIRVNCICPGVIESAMTSDIIPALQLDKIPQGRAGTAEEVAKVALFLASEDSSYVTGTALVVDGGLTIETKIPFKEIPAS